MFDVSIVVPVHREANLMQPTLRSLQQACSYASNKDLSIELVFVLDSSDSYTEKYLERAEKEVLNACLVHKYRVGYGNPADTRNHGIKQAKAAVVMVIDADDLISDKFIYDGYIAVKEKPDFIFHPEYVLSFGRYNEIYNVRNAIEDHFNESSLIQYNPWVNIFMCRREILIDNPFKAVTQDSPFGPEDWQWHLDIHSAGYLHKVLKGNVFFYRRKDDESMDQIHSSQNLLLSRTPALVNRKKIEIKSSYSHGEGNVDAVTLNAPYASGHVVTRGVKKIARLFNPIFRYNTRTRAFEYHFKLAVKGLIRGAPQATPETSADLNNSAEIVSLPLWLIKEWGNQYKYEHRLYPSSRLVDSMQEYVPNKTTNLVSSYWNILGQVQDEVDYFFIVPSLGIGGAELVTKNYISAIKKTNSQAKISVFVDENIENIDMRNIPEGVHVISAPDDFRSLTHDEQSYVLASILIQTGVRNIHLNSSSVGYRMLHRYGSQLSKKLDIYVSLFLPDYTIDGQRVHALLDNPRLSRYIKKIFTDNKNIIDRYNEWSGYDKSLFSVHYQPSSLHVDNKISTYKNEYIKILWAARLDTNKRPDRIEGVMEECKRRGIRVSIDVYGSPVLSDDHYLNLIQGSTQITYRGGFSGGLANIPDVDEYDVFLMTSDAEGLPNVILEAISNGLAVVAPAVGGVSEVINEQTGYLVKNAGDISSYANAVQAAHEDYQSRSLHQRVGKAQDLLKSRHSMRAFVSTLKDDNYL